MTTPSQKRILKKEVYRKALPMYGFATLCYLMDEYEGKEQYEECQILFDVLNEQNQLNRFIVGDLPTKFDEYGKEYFKKAFGEWGLTGEIAMENIPAYAEDVKDMIEMEVGLELKW